jgi:1,2-diacylglycerol 3-beta-glucosyltransferase
LYFARSPHSVESEGRILYIPRLLAIKPVSMVTVLLVFFSILYFFELLVFRRGLGISSRLPQDPAQLPSVSIIIAARNEEERILACLNSLRHLDYPTEKLEILIVDDCSTDKTSAIVREFIAEFGGITLLNTPPERGNLRGKTNAIAHGIKNSTGEIIMFTDADCSVSPGWVRSTVRYFARDTGIVGGYTILRSRSVFHGIQALDWLYLFGIASATSGLGIPLTAIGNNLSIRRDAYLETGGYEVIPFSVTEDYSLVQTILQKTRYAIRFPLEAEAVVTSEPCDTVSHLFRQKQRWGVGALDMVPIGMAIVAVGWLIRAVNVAAVVFLPWTTFLPSLTVLFIADYLFLSTMFTLPPFRSLRKYFIFFEIYITLYGLFIPFLAFVSRHVVWKERSLRKGKKNAFHEERH